MPKKKGWRKSESRRTDWRSRKIVHIGSPERMPAQSPERNQAQSPERMPAQSPERKPALNLEKPVQSNKLDKLAQKEKLQSKHETFQSRDLMENSSVNSPDSDGLYTLYHLSQPSILGMI